MNWTDQYNDLRSRAAEQLILCRFDLTKEWQESYEKDTAYRYELPSTILYNDGFYDTYSIVHFDGESFLGYNWDDGERFWFNIDELSLNCICKLIDLINES